MLITGLIKNIGSTYVCEYKLQGNSNSALININIILTIYWDLILFIKWFLVKP